MSRPLGIEEQVRYVYAALQHLEHERSIVDIAEELGVSRFMVGRMVRRVREDGLIEFRPRLSEPIDAGISQELEQCFGLRTALAVATPSEHPDHVRSLVAGVTARLMADLITEDDVVGLGPGRTIVEMCTKINAVATCDVVQLTGVVTSEVDAGVRAVMTLSRVAGGRMFPLYAPFVTTDAASARTIVAQPAVHQALQRMNRLDKTVLTIGGWPNGSLFAEQMREFGKLRLLEEAGVVAEIGTTLLDEHGRELHLLDDHTVGISTRQLTQVPVKVAIGGGREKERAVLAVLRSGLVDVLVTDVRTARLAIENGAPSRIP